jgi:YfiH family protein
VPGPNIVFTDRSHGDLAVGSVGVDDRRRALAPRAWSWLRQVHGAQVLLVDSPGAHAGDEADALVTATPGCVLSVQVADCAPVALVADGVVGVAHAGWRGLAEGVLPATADAMRGLGAERIEARLGPCIHPGCYEFGADDLEAVVARLGPEVRATTHAGAPALDLPAAVRASLAGAGVEVVADAGTCTACSAALWSHRASGDRERQAVVAWLGP